MSKKNFFSIVFGVIVAAVLFGFVLPALMSAKSGIAVSIALVVMFVIVVGGLYFVLFREPKKEVK